MKPLTIAITGPESTGKSDLAKGLAEHYNTTWVKEYAREYLEQLPGAYTYEDVLIIAKLQHEAILEARKEHSKIIFLDTELTVTKIWCEYKYGRCHPYILEKQQSQQFDLYLLCATDLPWQPDPLREHPDRRKELFALYKRELEHLDWPHEIVRGNGPGRLQQAIRIIEGLF
jgi:NadR type nicotinamide-nucleotide adenylyltransferase